MNLNVREPWEGSGRAPGGFWYDSERVRASVRMANEAHVKCWAAHMVFGMTFSDVWEPYGAQSLRFPLIMCSRALSLDACAMKSSAGE